MECFAQCMILLFLRQTQKFKDKSLLSLLKKIKLLPARLSVKFALAI